MNAREQAALNAARVSLAAAAAAFDPSPLDPVAVARAVGRSAYVNTRSPHFDVNSIPETVALGHLLGCWVDGKLRFQSRNHDNVHSYAQDAMNGQKHRTVWVAPVGSFVDEESASQDDARKTRRVKMGSRRG